MGLYDTVIGVPKGWDDQLKCWGVHMVPYAEQDKVPHVDKSVTYSILLRRTTGTSDRFLHVEECLLTAVGAEHPLPDAEVFDKWGRYCGYGKVNLRGKSPMVKHV